MSILPVWVASAAILGTTEGVAPAVVVFPMKARTDVSPDAAALVTEALLDALRRDGAFGRVLGVADMVETLDGTAREPIQACREDACMVEVAGALGAEYLLHGTVGRMGNSYLVNARLLGVESGDTVAVAAERISGTSHEALLDAILPVVQRLVREAGLTSATPTTKRPGPGLRAWVPWAVGAVAAGLLGLGTGVVSAGLVGCAVLTRVVAPELPGSGRFVLAWVPGYLVAGGLGAAGVLLAPWVLVLAAGLGLGGALASKA
jgi:TolB-like protein